MKWFDNQSVYVTAYRGTGDISHKVQRWDGKVKKHVMVDCPDIVKNYNSTMGSVDLADMLISLYCVPTRRDDGISWSLLIYSIFAKLTCSFCIEDMQPS